MDSLYTLSKCPGEMHASDFAEIASPVANFRIK